jgi:hypothetical protein
MSHPIRDAGQADIVQLTKAAVEAAEAGRWDLVIQYYQDRGALLDVVQGPVRGADSLLKLDEQVRDRASTAQAVLASLLGEAMVTRQRLQGFQQRLGALSSAPESLSVEA